jgi:dihydroneopterin aldolase
MSIYPYREVLKQVQYLSSDEQFQLLEDLVAMVRQRTVAKPLHSILELGTPGE